MIFYLCTPIENEGVGKITKSSCKDNKRCGVKALTMVQVHGTYGMFNES